ncbi:MAG: hypothetical protein QUT30_09630 [Acidobacteriota bacterium]|nr:hypothetical protein [Acidobacteriota bacterium]
MKQNRKLIIGLGCYAVLIAAAVYALQPIRTSNDRFLLGFVLCFFAILIVKTIIRFFQGRDEE